MTGEIGTVTMYPKLERREWIFTPAPDPRDARIAELEAALREIEHWCEIAVVPYLTLKAIRERANAALVPPPERDMTMVVEEWDA